MWTKKDAARRKERYHAAHAALVACLGGKCAECGSQYRLAIDHVDGRGYEARHLSYLVRVRRYYAEYSNGVKLRVLCRKCNGWDGARRQR